VRNIGSLVDGQRVNAEDEASKWINIVNEWKENVMLSARNQFEGIIKSIKLGTVMAEVVIAVGDIEFVAAITRGSAEGLGLKVGDKVKAVVKATEVMVAKD
jgi:molybdopterin-binding protein